MLLVWPTAFLTKKGEIEELLTHAVAQKLCKIFITKDGLVLKVRGYFADELALSYALRGVSVINNQEDGLVMFCFCAVAEFTQQLKVRRIQQFAPLDITIFHITIEHDLLATEQAA